MVTIQLDIPNQSSDATSGEPVRVIDERTRQIYYLISAEQFERLSSLLAEEEFRPQEMSPLISKTAAAAGWADPMMDDYDRYDERRPAR
ncbi:MAG: hypothetical protein WCH39_13975 [Schlesneria sp.]|jgi:hypothetical protein